MRVQNRFGRVRRKRYYRTAGMGIFVNVGDNVTAPSRDDTGKAPFATTQATSQIVGPRSSVESAIQALRNFGAWNGSLYLMSRFLVRATSGRCRLVKYYLVAQPVRPVPYLKRKTDIISIDRIEPDNPLVKQFPRPAEVLAKRFADGSVCFAASKHGKFVGFIWLQHYCYEEDEVRCNFFPAPREKAVWDYDVHVEPQFRMGRIFLRLWDVAHDYLRDRGIAWTVSRISAFNTESLASHRRLGAVRLAIATFVCVGDVQAACFSVHPWLHLSRRPDRRPDLRLLTHATTGAV